MIVTPYKTAIFKEGQSLPEFLVRFLPARVRERSVVVVTSKIVALSERRAASGSTERARIRLIRSESQWAMKTRHTWLTIRDGVVMASAGIDESNGNGRFILLPYDSFRSAMNIRQNLRRHFRLKHLGVLVTDSRLTPLREGIVGVALGYAGFRGVRDYRGKPDLFGRRLRMTRTNVADALATAAVLTMGEGDERQPLALITNAPVVFSERVSRTELLIDPRDDIYRPLFKQLGKGFHNYSRRIGKNP